MEFSEPLPSCVLARGQRTSASASRATSVGQVLAVPVGEDLALGLAVVGEHDEVVLPRRDRGDLLELGEDGVDALERGQRLRLQHAGVVGDGVVVDVVDVDRPVGPRSIASATSVVLRSRSTPVSAARSTAKPQPRCDAGAHVAAHRPRGPGTAPRTISLTVRDMLRARPPGRPRNWESATRACLGLPGAVHRAHRRVRRRGVAGEQVADRDAVVDEQAAAVACAWPRSPWRRRACSRRTPGRSARSTQRNAGIPSMVPCRMPIWLAGVVAGSLGRHSAIWWVPLRTQRDSVGSVPARTHHSSTG